MSKSTVDDFELGNLMFGNSRGIYNFPDRDLVDSPEWNELCKVLQVEDYHFVIGDYYLDYDKDCNKERTNKLEVTPYGGYICKDDNGQVVFETFPYWWGDCTCGAEEYNENLEEELLKPPLFRVCACVMVLSNPNGCYQIGRASCRERVF